MAQTIDNIVWWVGYISYHFRNYHFRIAIHFWISFQLKVNTMAVESLKSDSQLFSTEDPMAMQQPKNSTVAPFGTVDDTTVSSLRTYSQSA